MPSPYGGGVRRTPLVVAGLLTALVVSGCGGTADDSSSPEPADSTSPPASSEAPESTPDDGGGSETTLTVDTSADTGRCAVPTPEIVQGNDVAFDGVVDTVDETGLVTLRPTAFYAGEPTDTVTVQEPRADLQALLAAVDFRKGERYLVAATGGQVALCTITAPYTPRLAAVYEQAFGAPQ